MELASACGQSPHFSHNQPGYSMIWSWLNVGGKTKKSNQKQKAGGSKVQWSCISRYFLAILEDQGGRGHLLTLDFPFPLWGRLGQSWAVHPWNYMLLHQGALAYLFLLEDPSGQEPLPHPETQRQIKVMHAFLHLYLICTMLMCMMDVL